MKKTDTRRQYILEKLADHLLATGMKGASLRPMAAAADMSDRMLLHYFENKEELLTASLVLISDRLQTLLDASRSEPMPFKVLLPHLAGMIKDPRIRPFLRIWLELAASAARGEKHSRLVARKICNSFHGWISSAIKVRREEERKAVSALAFATIEGFVLLDALGSGSLVNSALEGLAIR